MSLRKGISLLAATLVLGVVVTTLRLAARPEVSPDAAAQLASAAGYYDSCVVLARVSRPQGRAGDALTVALGYLEQLRVGTGSPFRLVDEALDDPRLMNDGNRVAWALLARLRRGDAYVVDESVLNGSGPWQSDGRGATGAEHLALIEREVAAEGDPRIGELAVRLAYLIAAAEGTVSSSAPPVAARVAALVRDRHLAAEDLRDLLRQAARTHSNVLADLLQRRDARALRIERPTLQSLDSDARVAAMEAVPRIVDEIRALGSSGTADAPPAARFSELGPHFAERLVTLGQALPPSAPVVVTMESHRPRLLGDSTTDTVTDARQVAQQQLAQQRLALQATNEETLVGLDAPLAALPNPLRRTSALAVLASAVALRAMQQSEPWFPGDDAPSAADLEDRFGLESVTFASAVPSAWRPYYRRELGSALSDLQRVLPAFSPAGLHVTFAASALPDSALAMHDPRTRTLRLSIYTSGGTLAHELAHDVDRQAATRLYASNGYSTDRAIRDEHGTLAASMRNLAEARLISPMLGRRVRAHDERPAELFARSTDWFVASALAQQGRTNGFLSAVQDALLTGYAAGQPSAVGVIGTASLVSALEQMTYVPDSIRGGYVAQWADASSVDPVLLVRRVLDTPVSWRVTWPTRTALSPPVLAANEQQTPACVAHADSPEGRARARLLNLAVDARARGIAERRAHYRLSHGDATWAHSVLREPPWSPDEGDRLVHVLRGELLSELSTAPADQGLVSGVPAIFRSSAASCSNIEF